FECALIGQQLGDVIGKLVFGSMNDFGNAAQGAGGFLELAQRAFAGDGLDAADTGGDAALIDDLAEADVAGAPDVRAAAEFLAEAGYLDHAHLLAVLLAE